MAYPDAIERAFTTGAPLKLRIDLGGVLVPATGVLCPKALQPGPPQLWIKAPTLANGRSMPVPTGTRLTASFMLSTQHFGFETGVSTVRPYPGSYNVDVWIIGIPPALEPEQRRAAFRLHDWVSPPLKARLWGIGAGPPGALAMLESQVEDLSATGIGILVPPKGALGFPAGRTVGLNFRLTPEMPPIVLKGIVRSRRPKTKAKKDVVKLGVAFTETIRGPEDSRSIALVMRYVTEQERLQIQKERGGQ